MTESAVDIGILEEKSNWLLHPRFFPSKVGGKPAWLDLKKICNTAELTCKICNDPLVFLCQVYAPYEEKDDCFHRTIFVFICRNGTCCRTNCADNLKVLRCQLRRDNEFYSYEPYEEKENENFSMERWPKLCHVCGLKGPSHCAKCKKSFYCSRKHQILDWQKGHKESCSKLVQQDAESNILPNFIVTESGKSILFKEWELVVDVEDESSAGMRRAGRSAALLNKWTEDLVTYMISVSAELLGLWGQPFSSKKADTLYNDDEDNTCVDEKQEMEKLRKMMIENKAGTLNNISESELEQYAKHMPEDKVFNKFSKRVSRHPEQVLRYDRGGTPLWITGNTENNLIHIPNCQYCNGNRQFEFQVMPQLLNFINVGIDINSIDWGILAIYTCKNSCNNGPAYKEEYIIKQDLCN